MIALAIVAGMPAVSAHAQAPDILLVNGQVITLDAHAATAQAIAIRGDRIVATGTSAAISALAGPQTRTVELSGRTVIPGLIDSHMHAIRAALFYATEVNWIDARSLPEAMERMRAAAKAAQPGSWLIVAGGWTPQQFAEKRKPTQAELLAVAPDHPVYVQLFYSDALLTPKGLDALKITSDDDVKPRGKIERDDRGVPSGWIAGDNPTITALFGRLPVPTQAQSVTGTRQFFRELNRLGLTGVIDPGGYNMGPADYQPLFKVWSDKQLTVRVVFSMFAQRPGSELADYQALTQIMPMGFGDDMLRFNGIGEAVTWGMYNNDSPSEAQKNQLYDVATWAAGRQLTVTFHWNNNASAHHLFDVIERVANDTPIASLRWSVAHMNDASDASLQRMKALGLGWAMQDAMYFSGVPFIKSRGPEQAARTPPVMSALRLGLPVGAGTDAHRVMSYNPFVALQWLVDGRTVDGAETRPPDQIPSRAVALRLYTQGSAWFAHDESRRGALEAGRLADLAVLDRDYLAVPVSEIGRTQSLLTMVGGRIVYAAGPYAALEANREK